MNVPCELIVLHVLPRIRAIVARELVETHKLSQVEAAKILGITQPAISQYLKEARSKKITALETEEIHEKIKRMSANAKAGKGLGLELCEICGVLREKRMLCGLHKSLENVPKTCTLCGDIRCK